MQHTAYALEAQGLVRDFNGFRAVGGAHGVDLRVRSGSIHALIGPNGAGKTTCFNLLTRFIEPSAGSIMFEGRDITRLAADAVARLGLVRSFQISAVFAKLSVFENVRLAVQRHRRHSFDWWRSDKLLRVHDERAHALLEEVGLDRWARHLAGELPYGRKRALELATTLALEPRMLLLDEPMAGMGGEDIEHATELIRAAARGRTVLMVEHNLSVVATLCDRITVLAQGAVLAEGDYASIAADPRVAEAYLGKAASGRHAGARHV
jgi:branched-chain amino acid transport system ATP-binding protein